MSKQFALSAIVPVEDVTFRDDKYGGDGTVYPCRLRSDMDATDLARLQKIQAEMRMNLVVVQTGKSSKGTTVEQAAQNLETSVQQFISMIIPDLPQARAKSVPSTVWYEFIKWWRDQGAKADDPEATAPQTQQRVQRGKRSRDSQPVTA